MSNYLTVSEIRAWPIRHGWHVSPTGQHVRLGNNVVFVDRIQLGNRVMIGNNVELSHHVILCSDVRVGARTVIGYGTEIGPDTKIGTGVSIGRNVVLKDNVIINDGVVIGDRTYVNTKATLGDYTSFGANVSIGVGTRVGAHTSIGSNSTLGKYVTLGDYISLREWTCFDNELTSKQLNLDAIAALQRQHGKYMLATKWVTKDRKSPIVSNSRHQQVKYEKGWTIRVDGVVSDQQCSKGLHVLPLDHRPEWHGLIRASHDLIPLTVRVPTSKILFAGVGPMVGKMRVSELKVLD